MGDNLAINKMSRKSHKKLPGNEDWDRDRAREIIDISLHFSQNDRAKIFSHTSNDLQFNY